MSFLNHFIKTHIHTNDGFKSQFPG